VESSAHTPATKNSLGAFKTAVVYFALLAAVLQLCVFHLLPDAPVWHYQSKNSQQALQEQSLADWDKQCTDDAAGGNLELHFQGFDAGELHQGLLLSQFYFRANYALFPHRAFIGQADRPLNTAGEMAAADMVPDIDWLKQHDVHAVRIMTQTPAGIFGETRPVN
jgi:hypothetical protein